MSLDESVTRPVPATRVPAGVTVRPVRPDDVPAVVDMVHELAAFENASAECTLTGEQLHYALFMPGSALFGHVAVAPPAPPPPGDDPVGATGGGEVVGVALWFLNFSTWAGVHGIYLEDLYVRPTARGTGAGRALLAALAQVCVQRGYARLDWWVLDSTDLTPSRAFYRHLGGRELREWVPWRVDGDALRALAARDDARADGAQVADRRSTVG